jgi:hypothetical protein
MYILVNKSRILLGIFTDKNWLNAAITAQRNSYGDDVLYYQEIVPNEFSSVLINFWTMHPEKLIKISPETKSV